MTLMLILTAAVSSYNPVQCPFCNKGHRDNYNLKQHVCPVLNMKYGVFEKKEMEKKELESLGPSHNSSQKLVMKNMLKNS